MEEKAKEILWKIGTSDIHPDQAYRELCSLFKIAWQGEPTGLPFSTDRSEEYIKSGEPVFAIEDK